MPVHHAYSSAAGHITVFRGAVAAVTLWIIAYAHRNALGHYYYDRTEGKDELIQEADMPVPVQGSFEFRVWCIDTMIAAVCVYVKQS